MRRLALAQQQPNCHTRLFRHQGTNDSLWLLIMLVKKVANKRSVCCGCEALCIERHTRVGRQHRLFGRVCAVVLECCKVENLMFNV